MDITRTLNRCRNTLSVIRDELASGDSTPTRAMHELSNLADIGNVVLGAMEAQSAARAARADLAADRARRLGARVEQARTQQPEAGPEETQPRRTIGGSRAYWQPQRPSWLA